MPNEFITFQEFSDEGIARDITSKLEAENIECKVDKIPPLLDRIYIGFSSMNNVVIKIREDDFLKARETLAAYYSRLVNDVDKDYYLFEFSTSELKDIISKPDEWGPFDYQLSKKILAERNENISTVSLKDTFKERKAMLATPEKADTSLYIAAYFFLIVGTLSLFYYRIDLMPYLMFVPFMSFVIGIRIYKSIKTLPDGERVWTYEESDRKHGMIIMLVGITVSLAKLINYMFFF